MYVNLQSLKMRVSPRRESIKNCEYIALTALINYC